MHVSKSIEAATRAITSTKVYTQKTADWKYKRNDQLIFRLLRQIGAHESLDDIKARRQ